MKQRKIIFFWCLYFLLIGNCNVFAQKRANNYITGQYYHKIAQAQLHLLEGNEKECYEILHNVSKQHRLLNVPTRNELYQYLRLSLKYKEYTHVYDCMYELITVYGYKLDDFEYLMNFQKMKRKTNWKELKGKLLAAESSFVSDTALVQEFQQMLEDDQYYRVNNYGRIKALIKQDSTDPYHHDLSSFYNSSYMSLVDSINNINYNKILHIIETKGFPLSRSVKLTHFERDGIFSNLTVLFIHFIDSSQANYLKPILLKYIEQGDCPPEMIAFLFDNWQNVNGYPPYRMFTNVIPLPERIPDYKELEERRREIGLPSYEISRKIIIQKREKYSQ